MTKDFLKYQHIISDFSGEVLTADFEAKFALATKAVPKTDRFLLKMELKRLANPCTRLIDLRGHVNGECRAYEHEERIHYLDDIAIKVFQDNMADYGSYTFGVYEAVMNTENNFRVMYQREKLGEQDPGAKKTVQKVFEKTQYAAQLYKYGPYFDRQEERMNFAVAVDVAISKFKSVEATTSDISSKGCKLRFNEKLDLVIGQSLDITFTGLEGEFQFGKENFFQYQVKNIQVVDSIILVGFERIFTGEEKRDGFRQFLAGYIQGNKRRYKINLDNTIDAILARTFEQFTIPKSNELPVFISDESGSTLPRYALTCPNNQMIFQHWQDEKNQSTIENLITPERLLRLKKATKLGKDLIVYSFIHVSNGRYFFYTADNIQLEANKDFLPQYLTFAASKASFNIAKLSLLSVDVNDAYSPLTMANTLAKKEQYLNLPTSDDVKIELNKVCDIVTITQIDDNRILDEYKDLTNEKINTSKLKQFGHKRVKEVTRVDQIGINYRNQRGEPRFIYKTPVIAEAGGVKWSGGSLDFSTSGLKVELDKPSVLNKGDIIDVTFPQLQKITSAFELKCLPYEVMRINKKRTIINLRVHVEKYQHIGRSFFKALIEKNKSKLTPDEYELATPGLAKALRNIYSASVKVPSFVVQTSGSRYKIEVVTTHDKNNRLLGYCKQLSDRLKMFNLYPILSNLNATNSMNTSLKKMQASDNAITDVLYVSINPNNELVEQAVSSKLASEFVSEKVRNMFIRNALKRGELFCLQVKLSRTDEPDMQHLNPELSYISSYAIHRGKQLEQEIWSVVGVLEVFDITQEALIRYRLTSKDKAET